MNGDGQVFVPSLRTNVGMQLKSVWMNTNKINRRAMIQVGAT